MKLTSCPKFCLSKPAMDIPFDDVGLLTVGPLDILECFPPKKNTCPLIGICKLSKAFQDVPRAFLTILDDLTLADIAANRDDPITGISPIEDGYVAPIWK